MLKKDIGEYRMSKKVADQEDLRSQNWDGTGMKFTAFASKGNIVFLWKTYKQ